MNRRTLTMNFDALGAGDEDDSFFESCERLSSVVPMDLASGSEDDEDFEDSRMSFASAISSASIKRIYSVAKSSSILPSYDMWMAEPGDVQERRKRLLQGMGLLSKKEFVRLASSKSRIVRTISRKPESVSESKPKPKTEPEPESMPDATQDSTTKVDSSSTEESTENEPSPERKVVDWTDVHEMVTAACYTPDGQVAPFVPPQAKKLPGFQSQTGLGKITGFQFAPWNPAEVLITSADSRIGIYNESDLIQKFRGFRNISSQISASFSPDGKHVISASEDSNVYIWKVEETKNPGTGKRRSTVTVHAHENFHCKDVSVAIPWPVNIKNEPPSVEIHSKRHSKRLAAPPTPNSTADAASPSREDNLVGASGRKSLPPLPKKKNDASLERNTSCADEDFAESGLIDPGIGVSESFGSSSPSIRYGDSPSISASGRSPSQSWSSSDGGSGGNSQTIQATAWGMAIVTASLEGEIRVYQNFGLPLKVGRQTYLF